MTELYWLSAGEAGTLMRDGRLSPVAYVEALLERAEALQPLLHCFVHLTPELALRRARQAETELRTRACGQSLLGIPIGIKDVIDVAGVPTTAQSRLRADHTASADAAAVNRLFAAGAVCLGKTTTHEFAFGGPSFDLPWPPARNPWNPDHFTGGSSSGSAAAVAAGIVPVALGTDTGGSIRNPASLCGVVGMKPTYGLVDRAGVFPLAWSLDNVGPITRTVRDNATVLQELAGPGLVGADYAAQLEAGVEGLRIGVIRHFHTDDEVACEAQIAALESAAGRLGSVGAQIVELRVSPLGDYLAPAYLITAAESFSIHESWLRERPREYGSRAREGLMRGALMRAVDYINAQRVRARLTAEMTTALASVDAALTLSGFDPAPRIDDDEALARQFDRQARTPFSLTGHPAIAVPAGLADNGLPLSVQFVAGHFQEEKLYRVAAAHELLLDSASLRPTL